MNSIFVKKKILIFCPHQSHVGVNAGGYVRLKEFLKFVPNKFELYIIDASPSIFIERHHQHIWAIELPSPIHFLILHAFPIGVLCERLYTGITSYKVASYIIQSQKIDLLYVPIGELVHMLLPAVLLKQKFPHIKLVVDILNFEIIDINFISLVQKHISKKNTFITALMLSLLDMFSYMMTKKIINSVDYVFTVSNTLVRVLRRIYFKKTIDYTPSGIRIPPQQALTKKYLGIYVGRLTEQKGVFNLIETWKHVIKKDQEARLALVGLTSVSFHNNLLKIIKDSGLNKNIDVYPNVSEKLKYKLLFSSKIFLHLACYEPLFPVIGILEGLACNLPAITYNIDAISKNFEKPEFIRIVKNGNYSETVREIFKIGSLSSNRLKKLGYNARMYATQFNWEVIAKKEFDAFDYCLNS